MDKYIYESHMGGLYTSEYLLPWDYLYCETCGDSDWEMGLATNREEAKRMIEDRYMYSDEYIKQFLDDEFPEEEGADNDT